MRATDSENQECEDFFSRGLFARKVCAMFCNALSRPLHRYSKSAFTCCIDASKARVARCLMRADARHNDSSNIFA